MGAAVGADEGATVGAAADGRRGNRSQGTAEQNRTEKTTAPEQAKHTRKTKPYLQNRQLISASGSRAGQRLQEEEGKYML